MVEKYNIEELIIRFLKQEISEDELRYLETWLAEKNFHVFKRGDKDLFVSCRPTRLSG